MSIHYWCSVVRVESHQRKFQIKNLLTDIEPDDTDVEGKELLLNANVKISRQ